MKQFAKFLFASCLGTFLALLLISVVGISSIASMMNKEEKVTVKPNSVLKLSLGQPIPEKTNNVPPNTMSFELSNKTTLGLQDIIRTIETAKEDEDIKGIYMELSNVSAGMATSSVLRDALIDFKESKKFIVAYNNGYYAQGAYYLASVADKIYVNPVGGIDFSGFAAQVPFFKELLDKTGIKAQVLYAGKFKSATEPFRRTDMSEENRLQVSQYIGQSYEIFLQDISESRGIPVAELKRIANEYLARTAEATVELKMADGLKYKDEVLDELRERLGIDEDKDIDAISLGKYQKVAASKKDYKSKDKIAIVYAEGSIVDGEGEIGNIGGERYAKMIRKIRKDDKVKAIVLRVNSGGGSSLASEIIWRELKEAKEQGIKVVVSMGDVAASGGYYIAAEGEKIFAEPNTITGSIGVFGLIPSMGEFLRREVGITFDTIKTAQYATTGSVFYDLNESERALIQQSIDRVYDQFKSRVANGRDMTMEQVEEVAQGRVWTGAKAKEIGLVDELGGLEDAVAYAAEIAGLEKYRSVEYPKTKDKIQQIIDEITGKKPSDVFMKAEMGEYYQYYKMAKEVNQMKGVQARMPFQIEIINK